MAFEKFDSNPDLMIHNLGTGNGYFILEVIQAFIKASGQKIPYKIMLRRSGDISASWANANLVAKVLDWQTKHDLEKMCQEAWGWQRKHPNGY